MKINLQNYESYFLSYIDNELSLADKIEVEQFIKENPGYENEFASLKQTVLAVDNIIFENKSSLYRLEAMEASLPIAFKQKLYREETKVVKGFFTRPRLIGIASLAAMLLLLLSYKIYFTNPTNTLNEIVQNNNKENINKKEQDIARNIPNLDIENKPSTKYISNVINRPAHYLFTNENLPLEKGTNFIEQEIKIAENTNNETEKVISNITPETTINAISENNTPNISEYTTAINNTTINQYEEQENYNKINTEDHDRSIYIANFEIDGDKLRGISRRFNSIFKKNKNDKQK
jgi:hypothetical protein